MDLYGKTFLAKVAHIFIVYHPLKERKSVSVTKHKIWGIEICPKMSLSTPDFTFWAISQDRDAPGQFYLTTRDHHGCRNLGQHQSQIFWIFPRNELLKDLSTMVLSMFNVSFAVWHEKLYFSLAVHVITSNQNLPKISCPYCHAKGLLKIWDFWLVFLSILIILLSLEYIQIQCTQ